MCQNEYLWSKGLNITGTLVIPVWTEPADIAQLVERRTCKNNVSGHYRVCGFKSSGLPTKITNSLSDETLTLSQTTNFRLFQTERVFQI